MVYMDSHTGMVIMAIGVIIMGYLMFWFLNKMK
ncbi:hypothetical protein BigBertha_228 [Bacillus phage BigBertha]|uniref:Membrane protein n=7 Tax=Caudoviricetes TaxID=2731619 RepID=A0A7U3T9B9_9CAUD|nr:hypothetical protein BigBertha_228 [Bacillus phage BigBertha]YP_009055996.1 hypothetical protein LD11_gp231 [Bacillus phage Riley]YP_009206590.1 hypothetical protein AVV02_gp235 [Bacillus phage AvesoBmore]AMW61607.1 hypothetical protein JUGLONE_231 [Bacillus phage Juglone]ASZ75961.1 hypothetical protein TAFFO16_228 [Bacillus phage Taffo16]QDH49926.1 hypothetical protein BEYONPHE_239 [Bacillus phage Beyonphe]QPY77459.1 membrane protein [Bacillus phage Anthos]ULF48855.1 hypothetical protein